MWTQEEARDYPELLQRTQPCCHVTLRTVLQDISNLIAIGFQEGTF